MDGEEKDFIQFSQNVCYLTFILYLVLAKMFGLSVKAKTFDDC